jgi:hypothetical protein
MQGAEEVVDRFLRSIAEECAADAALVAAFVAVALEFSERYAISYDAWIDVGVSRSLLCQARIRRTPSGTPKCRRARVRRTIPGPAV